MSTPARNSAALRDQRIGRRIACTGGARILTEAEQCLTNRERLARWRIIQARLPVEATITPIRRKP